MRPLHTRYTPLRLICSFHCTLYRIMDSFLFCWRFHMWVYVRLYSAFVFDRQCHCGDVNDSVKNLFACFFRTMMERSFEYGVKRRHTHTEWKNKTYKPRHDIRQSQFIWAHTHISTRNTFTFTRYNQAQLINQTFARNIFEMRKVKISKYSSHSTMITLIYNQYGCRCNGCMKIPKRKKEIEMWWENQMKQSKPFSTIYLFSFWCPCMHVYDSIAPLTGARKRTNFNF